MEFREINQIDGRDFFEAMEIYVEAFPTNERHSVAVIHDRVKRGLSKLYVADLNREVSFLALLWPLKGTDFILLDYMATKDAHRGKGIASAFLRKVGTELMDGEKYLLLEVENPRFGDCTKEKEKRVTFYKRHGAKELKDVRYLLPALDGTIPTEMILMIFPEYRGEKLDGDSVRNVITQIYHELYNRQADDALLGTFVHSIGDDIKLI